MWVAQPISGSNIFRIPRFFVSFKPISPSPKSRAVWLTRKGRKKERIHFLNLRLLLRYLIMFSRMPKLHHFCFFLLISPTLLATKWGQGLRGLLCSRDCMIIKFYSELFRCLWCGNCSLLCCHYSVYKIDAGAWCCRCIVGGIDS